MAIGREEVEHNDRLVITSAHEPRSTGCAIARPRRLIIARVEAIRIALLVRRHGTALVEHDGAPAVVDPELFEVPRLLDRALVLRGVARVVRSLLRNVDCLLEHPLDDGEAFLVVGGQDRAGGEVFLDERDLPAEVELREMRVRMII